MGAFSKANDEMYPFSFTDIDERNKKIEKLTKENKLLTMELKALRMDMVKIKQIVNDRG